MSTRKKKRGGRGGASRVGRPAPGPQGARRARGGRSAPAGLPEDHLHIVPVRNMVLFPGVILPLLIGRPKSVRAIQEAARMKRPVGLLLQKEESIEEPTEDELFRVGTVAEVVRYLTGPENRHQAICQGQGRFRVLEFVQQDPVPIARIERVPFEEPGEGKWGRDIEARFHVLKGQTQEVLELWPAAPEEMSSTVDSIESPAMLADLVATFMDVPVEERQEVLEAFDLKTRLELVTQKLGRMAEVLRLSHKIREEAKGSLEKSQREYYLREQLHAIQKELGEGDEKASEIGELSRKIGAAGMPREVEEEVRKELRRLERMPEGAAEGSMLRTYLELMVELPWSRTTEERIELAAARRILDRDHHGLDSVKKRVLEFLAVRKLKPDGKSTNLCLVGPPGVGKTSLGQSIARAMGRKFVRVSLGGVHDEAEIRGHRRTYVGAMPGNVVQGMRKAGVANPVFMLDEMDKLGRGLHGDPSAALLEVLDPEQNSTFRDNYLGVPFDLHRVLFIGTANVAEGIPAPLRDRFEVIHLPGYTEEEKLTIARRYLVRRQRSEAGLTEKQLQIVDDALLEIVRRYTREAGVRNLERNIGALCRYVATLVASGKRRSMKVGRRQVATILGTPRFESEVAVRTQIPGVATGLAWTPYGGEILFIEATAMPGKGRLRLTGQLGEVMKESAQTALSLLRTKARRLELDPTLFEETDLHVHIPAGSIPKDGPSAGVAMYTALVSLLTKRRVRSDLAMTGEISLRGLVLPVGGIKEKVLGALAAGIRTVVLPKRNQADLDEIPDSARDKLEFVLVDRVEQVAEIAFEEPRRERATRAGSKKKRKKKAAGRPSPSRSSRAPAPRDRRPSLGQ